MADNKVRVWVGTRKGGYRIEGDRARRRWKVSGPFQEGKEVYHLMPDPRHPGTVYSAANSGWWGPQLLRSRDWGGKWTEVSVPGTPRMRERKPPLESPSPKFPITNLWHVEPGPVDEPRTVYLGVEPASLWRTEDEGATWEGIGGLNEHPTRRKWNPGAGGLCLHTILVDRTDSRRMFAGISAAGLFRTEDGGSHWTPVNRRVWAPFLPNQYPVFGQCVHKVVFDSGTPSTLYRQDHGGIYVSRDRADSWTRIGKAFDEDFGFVAASAPALPGNAFFVPLHGMTRTVAGAHFQVQRWSERSRSWTALPAKNAEPGDYGLHREGLATDALDPAGVYVGTTTGQLFYSRTGGKSWDRVPYNFPSIHSVEVSSPES